MTGLPPTRPTGLQVGVVGAGFMGEVHARAVRRTGGRVRRVVASRPDRAADAAAHLGADLVTADLDELLADDAVDVVHVCTPNATHAALVRAVLAAGRAVVCEKPLAVSVDEARELTELAAASGVVAAVPFVYRFYPSVRRARARLADGTSGPVRLLHGSYLQDWLADPADDDWRVDPATGGASRAFADIGVHWCDLLEFTTGHRIARLSARTLVAVPERGGRPVRTEDAAVVLVETDRGALGTLTVSQVSHGRKNRLSFTVDAVHESLAFDQEEPEGLWIGGRDANRVVLRGTAGEGRHSVLPPGHPQGYQDCFDAFVADAHAAVRGAVPDGLPTFDDGLRATHVTQAVLASAAAGGWVEVAPPPPLPLSPTPEQELVGS